MFTGIVKGLGTIISIEDREAFRVLRIDVGEHVQHPQIGASVSVNGACLTILKIEGSVLTFELMQETLKLTTFEYLKVGEKVNIETPLRIGDELGGHLVQGHIDGTAQILDKEQVGENTRMRFWVSEAIGKQVLHKGSVALDGVSLTVCDPVTYQKDYCFDVWLLPYTLERTTLGIKMVGEKVNLEVDYLVKAMLSRLEGLKLPS